MYSILTMCELCARQYAESFKVKPYPGRPTTEKKTFCEVCRKKFPADVLRQYVVIGKGAK